LTEDVREIQNKFGIIGRENELRKALAAVRSSKHLLIEGRVGVGKTVLAEAVAKYLRRPFYRVDGDERYTEQKLTGWFDPPLAIKNGYSKDAFLPGPIALAMENGAVLFINELNRMPEGVQNVLLPAMDEGKIDVPKIGTITARNGFLVLSTQNPREFIATSLLSEALRDRFELLTLDYQNENDEVAIVQTRTGISDLQLIGSVVKLVRATRGHPDIRRGASVRAAMSTCVLAFQMGPDGRTSIREAAHMALPTRIELNEEARKTVHEIIDELVEEYSAYKSDAGKIFSREPPEQTSSGTLAAGTHASDGTVNLLETLGDIVDVKTIPRDEMGWNIAQHYSQIKRQLKDKTLLPIAKKIAVKAIIYRTLQLLGPTRRLMEQVREPYAPGRTGEIDVEMTTEELLGKRDIDASDLIIESKVPKKAACVLMLDASLSMSGDKLALATASLGALAYKLKSVDYSVVVFDNIARVMKQVDQKVAVESLVGDLLDIHAMGLTNVEDSLKKGIQQLNHSTAKDKIGIIMTDGNYTAGKDPTHIAAQYPKLFVIMIKSHDSRPELCERMAALGKGRFVAVDTFDEVPRVLRNILRDLAYRSYGRPGPQEAS